MPAPVVASIAAARLLVGALGERVGWWSSSFTVPAAQRTFERLFPRSAPRAALESVSAVVRRDHDENFHLGPRTTHLFRLPDHMEDRLAAWLASSEAAIAWPPADIDAIRTALEAMARPVDGTTLGSVCLGRPARLARHDAVQEVVGWYLAAAARGERAVPYFEEAS